MELSTFDKTRGWLNIAEQILPKYRGDITGPSDLEVDEHGFDVRYQICTQEHGNHQVTVKVDLSNLEGRLDIQLSTSTHLFAYPKLAEWVINQVNLKKGRLGYWSQDANGPIYLLLSPPLGDKTAIKEAVLQALADQDILFEKLDEGEGRLN